MTKVTIVALIYRSPALADWVWRSAHRYTPMLARGEADFLFVANDPTPALRDHLERRGYPHIININRRYSEQELFEMGYGAPEHMSRVYRGYNQGVRAAGGDYVVLVNSDNFFSPDWLENLLKYSDRSRVISSKLVERSHPSFGVFPGAIEADFGDCTTAFDEQAFVDFTLRTKRTGLEVGGAYMPALFHRDLLIESGLYPAGNIAGSSFREVARYGDEMLYEVLRSIGIQHFTALDSIVYHLKEGEREEAVSADVVGPAAEMLNVAETEAVRYTAETSVHSVGHVLEPNRRHSELMHKLVGGPVHRPPLSTRLRVPGSLKAMARRMLPRTIVERLRDWDHAR